jgi:ATP-dependent exoDNAse (exonuclease V) beta subunit
VSRGLTAEQSAAVERRGESLLVPANAGSGKTTVLVERFVRAVRDDGVPVDGILAITFTEKSAAELKVRIRRRFLELGEREHARNAERAWISTIHGFCSRILRRHALAAGIDPEYRILQEGEAVRIAAEAFDAALEEFLTGADRDRLDLVAARTPDGLETMVRTVHERLRSSGQDRPELPEMEAPEPRGERAALREAVTEALSALDGVDGKTVAKAMAKLSDCADAVDALGDLELGDAGEFEAFRFSTGNVRALDVPAVQAALEALNAFVDACRARDEHAQYVLLRELLSLYAERYATAKAAQSALDFEDLQLRMRELVRRESALRERLQRRFAHVLVDEFQDTNELQVDLIGLVAREDTLFRVGDELQSIYGFRNADVDVFRRAREEAAEAGRVTPLTANWRSDPEILRALNLAFDDVFDTFTPLEPPPDDTPDGSARPGDQLSLDPDERPAPPASGPPPVELLMVDRSAPRWKEKLAELELDDEPFGASLVGVGQPWRAAEMRLLAARIRRLLDEEDFEPGDIVVLCRATGDLPRYERALEERGIKTYLAGGGGYWSQQQVADLRAYLSVLANPLDEESLYFVLASPLVGASLDALASIGLRAKRLRRDAWWTLEAGLAGGDGSDGLADALGVEADRIRGFVERLHTERSRCTRLPLDALLERAITDSGYDRAILRLRSGTRRLANVRKLMRLAREYEADRGRDVRGFIDFLDEQDVTSRREGEAPLESADLGAVRLMTIHAAKGLEFPVVCLADMGREGRGDDDPLQITRDGRVGLEIASLGRGKQRRQGLDEIRKEQEAIQDEEERRVFYVGMTRAERRLILSGAVDLEDLPEAKPLGVPYDWIWRAIVPALADAAAAGESRFAAEREWGGERARVAGTLLRPENLVELLPPGDRAPAEEAGRAGVAPAGPLREFERFEAAPALPVSRLSYSGLSRYRSCGYRFYLERVVRMPPLGAAAQARDRPPDPPGSDELAPLLRGSVVHQLLERIDFANPVAPDAEEVGALLASYGVEPKTSAVEDVRRLVAAVSRSPLCERVAGAERVRREQAFAYELAPPGAGGRTLLANGVVDVRAEESGGTLIVDYKTDPLEGIDPEELCARNYAVQRLMYALAALRGGSARVEVAYCFLERPETPVSASWEGQDADQLEHELLKLAGGVVERRFAPTGEPHRQLCVECPGRTRLCSWPPEMTLRDDATLGT